MKKKEPINKNTQIRNNTRKYTTQSNNTTKPKHFIYFVLTFILLLHNSSTEICHYVSIYNIHDKIIYTVQWVIKSQHVIVVAHTFESSFV